MNNVSVGQLVNAINHAHDAITHTLTQIRDNPSVGYYLGELTQTFELLTACDRELSLLGSDIPTAQQVTIDQVRTKWAPQNPKDPASDPAQKCNCGECMPAGVGFTWDEDDYMEYLNLCERLKSLCESYCSRECATAPHLAGSSQHLDAIQAKLERRSHD